MEVDIPEVAELNAAVSAPVEPFEFVRDLELYLKEHKLDIDMQMILEGVG